MLKCTSSFTTKLAAFALTTALLGTSAFAACSPTTERRGGVQRNGSTTSESFVVETYEVRSAGVEHSHGRGFGPTTARGDINVEMPNDNTIFYHYLDHGGFRHSSDIGATPYAYWQSYPSGGGWCTSTAPSGWATQVYINMPRDTTLNFRAGNAPIAGAEFITTLDHVNNQKVEKLHTANSSGSFVICPPISTHNKISYGGAFYNQYGTTFPTSRDGYIKSSMGIKLGAGGFIHQFSLSKNEAINGGSKTLSVPAATTINVRAMGGALRNSPVILYRQSGSTWQQINELSVATNSAGAATFYIPTNVASNCRQVAVGIPDNGSVRLYGMYDLSTPKSISIDHVVSGRPSLLTPANNAAVNTPITFQWENMSSTPNHGFYWIYVYQNGQLYDEGGFTANSISGIVYPAGSYQWQVEAYDVNGYLYATSDVRGFSIAGARAAMQSKSFSPNTIANQTDSNAFTMTKVGAPADQAMNLGSIEASTVVKPIVMNGVFANDEATVNTQNIVDPDCVTCN